MFQVVKLATTVNLEAEVRAGLRQAAETKSIRVIAKESGVSYTTLYRLLDPDDEYRPNKSTIASLSTYLRRHPHFSRRVVKNVTNEVREATMSSYSPGPAVAKLNPRAQAVILQYLKRLEATELGDEEMAVLEHLLANREFAKRLSAVGRAPLSDDDEILLIEDTWRTIAETLALRGIRP